MADRSVVATNAAAPTRRHAGRRLRGLVAAAVLGMSVVAACGSGGTGAAGTFRPIHPDRLTVATAFFPAPGFWEGAPDAPTGGFEWALARALADRFHLRSVSVVHVAFGDLVAGRLGGADLALSELTPTAARRKVLEFSSPYLVSPPGVVVRPGTETPDLAAIRTLRWVAVRGSTLTQLIHEQVRPHEPPLEVDARSQALDAIDSGRAEAMLLDLPVGVGLARSAPQRYVVSAQLSGPEGLAAALPAGSENLDAVDTAMHAFVADGTIDGLSSRWLGARLSTGDAHLPLIRTEA